LIEEFKELEKKYNTLQIELSLLNEEVEIYKIQYEEKEGRIIELQNENSALV
jgi:ABC-type phosphate transport system auxiliary subunit